MDNVLVFRHRELTVSGETEEVRHPLKDNNRAEEGRLFTRGRVKIMAKIRNRELSVAPVVQKQSVYSDRDVPANVLVMTSSTSPLLY